MIAIMSKTFVEQLVALSPEYRVLKKGTFLFRESDVVRSVYVVEEGMVELTRSQRDGTLIILQRAARQAVLAEASVYSNIYHCDAYVAMASGVFQLAKTRFLEQLEADRRFSRLWSSHLAHEVHSARYRSEILTKKTVSERLDSWLAWHEYEIPEKGQWKGVAEQIGVSPEALYRELAKRRDK